MFDFIENNPSKKHFILKIIISFILLISFIAFPKQKVQAAPSTYYVSPTGNDSFPGTISQPWKTIGKAANTVKAGDTVYLRGGTYNQAAVFSTSGTASNPITLAAYTGETPIIDGTRTIPSYGSYLLSIHGNYINVSGIEICNSNYGGLYIDGNYDVIDNVYSHHNVGVGIYVSKGQYDVVQNSRVWRNSLSNEYGTAGSWGSGLTVGRNGASYATLSNNTVWENWGEGISTYEADHVTIYGNVSHDNYTTNIYISNATNVLCKSNLVYMDPSSYVYGGTGSNVGIMMGDEKTNILSANITVINNIAYGNHRNFHWWKGVGVGMNNVLIANNTFVNSTGSVSSGEGNVIISPGTHTNSRFENNIVSQDDSFPVIATVSQPGITYSNNLWSKTPYAAASGPGDMIGDPSFTRSGSPFSTDWFKVTYSSPAINKGLTLSEVNVDYFGNLRDGFTDMGAYEFSSTSTVFSDVPTGYSETLGGVNYPLYSYIMALYNAGYTAGCSTNPLLYCPSNILTRAESSVFMLRSQYGVSYAAPAPPYNTFTAEDWSMGLWAQKWAEGMWQAGLTAGCSTNPLKFCPWDQLTREAAIVFGLRIKYGSSYMPPAATGTVFEDMPDANYWSTDWAEQAYKDGLLPACGTGAGGKPLFCPYTKIDRAWAAYMIVIAKGLPIE